MLLEKISSKPAMSTTIKGGVLSWVLVLISKYKTIPDISKIFKEKYKEMYELY